jgi:DNA-binding transcriptional LysR family regulator
MISCPSISDAYRVEAQLLRTFVTVVRRASFSAAAAELGYTQAAVSQQIAALETDLKTQLLTRRPVTPTEAGARLLEHAEPILLRLDAARADVTRMTKAPPASLVVGVTPLAGASPALAPALAELGRRMPRLRITVQTGTRADIATAVARGDLDLGLTDGLTAPGDPLQELVPVTAVGVGQASVAVLLPVGHPLATRRAVRLTDLADARWIAADNVGPTLEEIRRHANTEGFRPAFRYSGSDLLTLIRLASAGHGLTLLPAMVLPVLPSTGIAAVPVSMPKLSHRIELIHGTFRESSPAAELATLVSAPAPYPPARELPGEVLAEDGGSLGAPRCSQRSTIFRGRPGGGL